MPAKRRYARIAITLPADDLAAADRVARQQDRARSWVIAEAVRHYVASADGAPMTRGKASPHAGAGLGVSRRAQLIADLALTPEQRVRAAEETARVSAVRRPQIGKRLVAFDRYEDYLEWKRVEGRGG